MKFKIVTHTILMEYDSIWRYMSKELQKPAKIKYRNGAFTTTVQRIVSYDKVGQKYKYKVII